MFHIIKGSSFDLLLSASAANGTLPALVTKLLMFNDGCKESQGESVKVSQNRAALFDMTFLMLVYVVQCFGSCVVLQDMQACFFSQWAAQCMAEPGRVKPLGNFSAQESLVDSLLQQFTQGEVRTQVVKWNSVCSSVHGVMAEMLVAAEAGALARDTMHRLTSKLSSQLCCFPVCIVSWLVSYSHYGEGGEGVTAGQVVDRFLVDPGEAEEGEGLQYFQQRSTMMVGIVRRMRAEMVRAGEEDSAALQAQFAALWAEAWRRGRLDIAGTRQAARLLQVGGPEWLVRAAVEQLGKQVYGEEVARATGLVFSLLHLDLVACTLALLVHVLPRVLAGDGTDPLLAFPTGRALARLTVHCLAAALANRSHPPYLAAPGRAAALQALVGAGRPTKLRRGVGGEAVAVGEAVGQEALLEEAHAGLFHLLASLVAAPLLSPRAEFAACLLEEGAGAGREARAVLRPLPPALLLQLVKVHPARFPLTIVAKMFDQSCSTGRKTSARTLCLMRNMRVGREALEAEV